MCKDRVKTGDRAMRDRATRAGRRAVGKCAGRAMSLRRAFRFGTVTFMAKHANGLLSLDHERAWFEEDVVARFLRYARVHTTSDRHNPQTPSTEGQRRLAQMLETELRELGIEDLELDEHSYLIARLPATRGCENVPAVGFLAHLDTSPDMSGENVTPVLHHDYDGGPLELGHGYRLDPEDSPALRGYIGETIITSDGSTLLGADNKAGVAEIVTAAAFLVRNPDIPHGPIELAFTPDEEIGRGMDRFPLERLQSRFCYTIDGGLEGSIEPECFNAHRVRAAITGQVVHPGYARGRLVNAATVAAEFVSALPRSESPEATDGDYGFYCPVELRAGLGSAEVDLIVRDFTGPELQRRIAYLEALAAGLEAKFPGAQVKLQIEQQYRNMRTEIDRHPEILELVERAVRAVGIEPKFSKIRGGTDGARLTEMGVPTPNVFSGAQNLHGRYEWVAVRAMGAAAKTVINVAAAYAELNGTRAELER